MLKKTSDLEKRNIPHDDHCRWTAPSEASTVKMVATVVKVCFYIFIIAGASFEPQDILQTRTEFWVKLESPSIEVTSSLQH